MNYSSKIKSNYLIVRFEGDLIGENRRNELYNSIKGSIEKGVNHCAIDITNVRYINSSGIGVLITILTKFRNKGGEVVLIKPSDHVKKLLVITKLTNIFKVVEHESEVEAAFKDD